MRWCSNVWALVEKELKHYFFSPIAYVVMMIFLTLSGYFFFTGVVNFQQQFSYIKNMMQIYQNPELLARMNLNEMVIARALGNMVITFIFLLPLIMMRSFAEEKRQKTEELLMTSPITTGELLAGKFFGSLVFVVILLLPTLAYQALLFVFSEPEIGPVVTGYAAVLLFASAGIAIGLFASSVTENQIIAAVISFVILLFMLIIANLRVPEESFFGPIIAYLAVGQHLENLLKGMLDTKDLFYFGSIIFLFLFLTKRSIESVRWR
jgi:ABC-2 type transport system permease protein